MPVVAMLVPVVVASVMVGMPLVYVPPHAVKLNSAVAIAASDRNFLNTISPG